MTHYLPAHRLVSRAPTAPLLAGTALFITLLALPGCNSLNPLCGSARPSPSLSTISPTSVTLAEVDKGVVLSLNGSNFVSASVVVFNGATLPTTIVSSKQLQVTLTSSLITEVGTAAVAVNTPGGNSSSLGCTSGGTSKTLTLTIM
jgi:hypothetical protein